MPVEITRVGRHKLLKAGVVLSEHTDSDEAIQKAINLGPGEYEVQMAKKKINVPPAPAPTPAPPPVPVPVPEPPPVPEPQPQPTPTPQPPPTPTPVPGAGRQLLGGWRLAEEFPRGSIAIDFSRMKLWMVGHEQRSEILEFDLPAMGTGTDVHGWPRVDPARRLPGWWPWFVDDLGTQQKTYAHGLCFWRGKLWVAPRVFYAQRTVGSKSLGIYAEDGEVLEFPTLAMQRFSGFVKRGPGLDPLLGCGGYESGQGTPAGPSLATLDGQVLISYGTITGLQSPGDNLEHWNERAPREPNYHYTPSDPAVDGWLAWEPRMVNGVLEGRWASDRLYGGGVVLPEGITYWAWMGTGTLNYRLQTYTFAPDDLNRTYVYRYDPTTYQLLGYQEAPEFGSGPILGQEIGPDGAVYLAHGRQWTSGMYQQDVALKVFG